jgi:hypothetical protein
LKDIKVNISTLSLKGYSKNQREKQTTFKKYMTVNFNQLESMLYRDFMYSPFGFKTNYRKTDNICQPAKFMVIDVDTTNISIYDRHQELKDEDIIHLIATTSNPDNIYKYRVLIPFSHELYEFDYRYLVRGVRLKGLIEDMDVASEKPAQPFYSYENSKVLINLEGDVLNVEDYIITPEENSIYIDKAVTIDSEDFKLMCEQYRMARQGYRSRTLIKIGYEMANKGYSKAEIRKGLYYINNMWVSPKSDSELERRVLYIFK